MVYLDLVLKHFYLVQNPQKVNKQKFGLKIRDSYFLFELAERDR